MKKFMIGINLILLFIFPLQARAGAPLDTVQSYVDHVLEVLRDPNLKVESAKAIKKKKIESIASDMFDFAELSKLTLGNNWKKLNNKQQGEFIELYRAIIENAYMDRIMAYTNERVLFDKEIMLPDNKAEVRSLIITSTAEIPIYYRMLRSNGEWKVYDVIIEGVSLIKNYRAQFKEILLKDSVEELLKILREKVKGS
jgi:phospholipid transport system substrate-binding protein